jgi:hypothetical protein
MSPRSGVVPDRRMYRRIRAPFGCRPAGEPSLARHLEPIDVSLGGLRVGSDERFAVGALVKLDIVLPEVPPVSYTAEVVWEDDLPSATPARFRVR